MGSCVERVTDIGELGDRVGEQAGDTGLSTSQRQLPPRRWLLGSVSRGTGSVRFHTRTWQATASGFESSPYGVKFLSAGATEASFVGLNWTNVTWNGTSGPCQALPTNGTNMLNQTGATSAMNLSASNLTTSSSSSLTLVCLNAVNNGTISYLWQNYSGVDPLNQTGWDNITGAANNSLGLPSFNLGLNETGENATGAINITGCNPVIDANNITGDAELANCPFFAGNNRDDGTCPTMGSICRTGRGSAMRC